MVIEANLFYLVPRTNDTVHPQGPRVTKAMLPKFLAFAATAYPRQPTLPEYLDICCELSHFGGPFEDAPPPRRPGGLSFTFCCTAGASLTSGDLQSQCSPSSSLITSHSLQGAGLLKAMHLLLQHACNYSSPSSRLCNSRFAQQWKTLSIFAQGS